jgi:hypothetical protein
MALTSEGHHHLATTWPINNMADQQGLSNIPGNHPVDGHGATSSPLRDELHSAESLLEMSQNVVVTQLSQEGESFHI